MPASAAVPARKSGRAMAEVSAAGHGSSPEGAKPSSSSTRLAFDESGLGGVSGEGRIDISHLIAKIKQLFYNAVVNRRQPAMSQRGAVGKEATDLSWERGRPACISKSPRG